MSTLSRLLVPRVGGAMRVAGAARPLGLLCAAPRALGRPAGASPALLALRSPTPLQPGGRGMHNAALPCALLGRLLLRGPAAPARGAIAPALGAFAPAGATRGKHFTNKSQTNGHRRGGARAFPIKNRQKHKYRMAVLKAGYKLPNTRYKLKSHKGAKKRFVMMEDGTWWHKPAGHQHGIARKSRHRQTLKKRKLKQVTAYGIVKKLNRLLPKGGTMQLPERHQISKLWERPEGWGVSAREDREMAAAVKAKAQGALRAKAMKALEKAAAEAAAAASGAEARA